MIKVENRERIRRAYFKEKKSQRQIARELGHSRKTVRKAIESAEPGDYALRKARPAPVLGAYKARIDELLEENERLPRKQRYTGYGIYKDIQAKHICRRDFCEGLVYGVEEDLQVVGVV